MRRCPPPDTRLRVISQAAAVLSAVVGTAQFIELFINRVLRPDLDEWTWISDVLIFAGLLVMTAQWTRLRLARTAIADLERERLTIRTELAVAAKVQRALLPLIPGPAHGITWHAVMEPAGEIGGDYYDSSLWATSGCAWSWPMCPGRAYRRPSSCPTREQCFERLRAKDGRPQPASSPLSPTCFSWMVEATST